MDKNTTHMDLGSVPARERIRYPGMAHNDAATVGNFTRALRDVLCDSGSGSAGSLRCNRCKCTHYSMTIW